VTEYEIRIEPFAKRLRVEFNGEWVADTTRAVVLHETRHEPAYYIPWQDIRGEFLHKTEHRTHCPFKGNASYWTLRVAGETAENALWSYEDPSEDGAPLKGYASFYRDRIGALYEGDDELAFTEVEAPYGNAIVTWLVRDAWKAGAADELVGMLCECLTGNGVPLARMTVIVPTLHPQIFASVFVWRDDTRQVKTIFEPHDILHQPKFAQSPFAPIIRGAGGVRRRLEGTEVTLDFPVLRDLHAEGATDYVAMPFRFSDGQINVVSMTSFAPGGFTTAHLGSIHEMLPALARLFEVHAQRRVAVNLLETYLGRHTGKRVLDGEIKHGDGRLIHAVIWFCDLRDSTHLADSMDHASYLMNLNRFFTAMAGAIVDNGGEILSYIGDAVLAIFPIDDAATDSDAGIACTRALDAARSAGERIAWENAQRPDLPQLRYGIGLHVGDVTYGNIGIPQRLQFTVIGSAANEASRIEGMTKELRVPVVASSQFAARYPGRLASHGRHVLKGVAGEHELFALP
jgi:adenylate cyclase